MIVEDRDIVVAIFGRKTLPSLVFEKRTHFFFFIDEANTEESRTMRLDPNNMMPALAPIRV